MELITSIGRGIEIATACHEVASLTSSLVKQIVEQWQTRNEAAEEGACKISEEEAKTATETVAKGVGEIFATSVEHCLKDRVQANVHHFIRRHVVQRAQKFVENKVPKLSTSQQRERLYAFRDHYRTRARIQRGAKASLPRVCPEKMVQKVKTFVEMEGYQAGMYELHAAGEALGFKAIVLDESMKPLRSVGSDDPNARCIELSYDQEKRHFQPMVDGKMIDIPSKNQSCLWTAVSHLTKIPQAELRKQAAKCLLASGPEACVHVLGAHAHQPGSFAQDMVNLLGGTQDENYQYPAEINYYYPKKGDQDQLGEFLGRVVNELQDKSDPTSKVNDSIPKWSQMIGAMVFETKNGNVLVVAPSGSKEFTVELRERINQIATNVFGQVEIRHYENAKKESYYDNFFQERGGEAVKRCAAKNCVAESMIYFAHHPDPDLKWQKFALREQPPKDSKQQKEADKNGSLYDLNQAQNLRHADRESAVRSYHYIAESCQNCVEHLPQAGWLGPQQDGKPDGLRRFQQT